MNALREMPVEIADELPGVECRVAFLKAACFAIGELSDADLVLADAKAWLGLYYWTQDLEDMLHRLNTLANSD